MKVLMWNDTTDESPREDILVSEGWFEYNGGGKNAIGEQQNEPWFIVTEDPVEADLIVWITTMAIVEEEQPPIDSLLHAHKVIVLDYADGCNVHAELDTLKQNKTLMAYFKRSFVKRNPTSKAYERNCTNLPDDNTVMPYSYSGSRFMMLPSDSPEADPSYAVQYGWIEHNNTDDSSNSSNNNNSNNDDNGYFKDKRYDNFLIPFEDRKWTITTTLLDDDDTHNQARRNVVRWTKQFVEGKRRKDKDSNQHNSSSSSFTAYIGGVQQGCWGYCFGRNNMRHLRNSQIVVTCNPSEWEGDFRLWESLLAGALVMVDEMLIPQWMPHPLVHGEHYVVYNRNDEKDFLRKLEYYSDPSHRNESRAIAERGYEFVLKHHMATDRVDYILEAVRGELEEHTSDLLKRELLGLSLQ